MIKKVVKKTKKTNKPKKNDYFTKVHEEAIIEYCTTSEKERKEWLYENVIRHALESLTENLIYIYNFHKQWDDIRSLKQDCVINLFETLHKYDATKGSRAFSYFNVVAKHWLIIQTRKRNKINFKNISIDDTDNNINIDGLFYQSGKYEPSPEQKIKQREDLEAMKNLCLKVESLLTKERDIKCMSAVLEIFDRVDELDFLNKRALFIYIREISGLSNKELSSALGNIRNVYKNIHGKGKEFNVL